MLRVVLPSTLLSSSHGRCMAMREQQKAHPILGGLFCCSAAAGVRLLRGELSEECREFIAENEIAPSGFVDAATAAVAVLTGAIYDPFGETI